MSTHYNLSHLIKITVFSNRIDSSRSWKPTKKILFGLITIRKEGIYHHLFPNTPDKLPEDCFIKDNLIFKKPTVRYHYTNGYELEFYADSMENINKHVQETLAKCLDKFIEVNTI